MEYIDNSKAVQTSGTITFSPHNRKFPQLLSALSPQQSPPPLLWSLHFSSGVQPTTGSRWNWMGPLTSSRVRQTPKSLLSQMISNSHSVFVPNTRSLSPFNQPKLSVGALAKSKLSLLKYFILFKQEEYPFKMREGSNGSLRSRTYIPL